MNPSPSPGPGAGPLELAETADQVRMRRIRELGLDRPDPALDELAARLARAAGAPVAMINAFSDRQHFVGLHAPADSNLSPVGRNMPIDHGFCPEVLEREGNALVLHDVCAKPRFAANPVVDLLGIGSYAGAPLVDDESGAVLGTVCFIDAEPRDGDARRTLSLIKHHRDHIREFIAQRAEQQRTVQP